MPVEMILVQINERGSKASKWTLVIKFSEKIISHAHSGQSYKASTNRNLRLQSRT